MASHTRALLYSPNRQAMQRKFPRFVEGSKLRPFHATRSAHPTAHLACFFELPVMDF